MTQPTRAERLAASRSARRPYLGAGAFLGVVAAVFLGIFGATLLLPHNPYIRYQGFQGTIFSRLDWTYERLAFSPTPIDILIVGSSRSARGINATLLEQALAARGQDLHVANISEPAAGLDIRLTKIREALAHHPEIKMIIFDLAEALPRDGHQAFGDLGTVGEVLTAPWIVNRTLPENLLRLPYRQMELALATAIPDAFDRRNDFDPATYAGDAPDMRAFDDPDWQSAADAGKLSSPEHAEALARETRQRRREITPPVLPQSLSWIEFGVSQHYVREVSRLAAAHDVDLAFLFLPFYQGYDAPIDAEWVSRYGPIWNAQFLKSDPRNYLDAAHASPIGTDLITPWLADNIAARLEGARS